MEGGMESGNVVRLPHFASRVGVLEYTVLFRVQGAELGFKIFGVQNTEKDKMAVAAAFEEAAKLLRGDL